jgi:ABC-type sugar transport system substrate-binding protein
MKARFLLSIAAAALITAGCSRSDTSSTTQAATKGRLFGVTFQTMNNPFFVELNEGIRKVVEAHGDRLVTLDAQWNSLKQKNDISDLIHQGVAAIKAGKLYSTSAQFPAEIGRIAAEKAYDGLAGKPVEKDIKIKVELITRENADSFLKKG